MSINWGRFLHKVLKAWTAESSLGMERETKAGLGSKKRAALDAVEELASADSMCSGNLAMAAAEQPLAKEGQHALCDFPWSNGNRCLFTLARTLMADQSYSSSQVWLEETVCLLGTFTRTWMRSYLQTVRFSAPCPPPAPKSCVNALSFS